MIKTILEDSGKWLRFRSCQTRGAILQLANKAGKLTTLRRPVQLLYPLGVSQSVTQEETDDKIEQEDDKIEPEEERSEPPERPQRRAEDGTVRSKEQTDNDCS